MTKRANPPTIKKIVGQEVPAFGTPGMTDGAGDTVGDGDGLHVQSVSVWHTGKRQFPFV